MDLDVRPLASHAEREAAHALADRILGLSQLPDNHHTLEFYAQRLAASPALLVAAWGRGEVVGCVFASLEGDHVTIGLVAVDAAHRRRGLGSRLLGAVEEAAHELLGHSYLVLGAHRAAEPFYLANGYTARLFVQVNESGREAELLAMRADVPILGSGEEPGRSFITLRTTGIDRDLQDRYDASFPDGHTQYIFIKKF